MKTGVIILSHGSKAEASNQTFQKFCQSAAESLGRDFVQGAFLQFAEPRLEEVVQVASEKGIEKLVVVPLFLFPGNHVQKDIPAVLDELKEEYQDMEFTYADHIGADNRLISIVADRVKEVI